MHILLIHQVFITPSQGGGTRHFELGKYLAERGHKITIIASDTDYFTASKKQLDEIPEGMTIHYIPVYKGHNKSIINRALAFLHFSWSCFFKALSIKNVDLVWGTTPPLFQTLSTLIAAKCKRKPFVLEIRDLWIDFAKQLGVVKNPFIIWFFKKLEGWIYRSADHVIVNSPGFLPYLKPTLPNQDIHNFPNGVIAADFMNPDSQKTATFLEQYPLKDKFIALYAGNLGKANDIECILDAAYQLKDHPDIRFVLLGGGLSVKQFQADCESRGLHNVIFIPSIPKKEIPHFMPIASVGIASLKDIPLFSTVYPNKVFDYMAAGIPTILSIGGVIRDVIEKSEGGTYIPPSNSEILKNTILYYFNHPEQIKHEGQNARHYVQAHFDREKIASDLETYFKTIVKSNS